MQRHLASLDGLRGVAAVAVVLHHVELFCGFSLPYFRQGELAVDFFFVLSGFVIALAYERRLATDLSWFDYMAVRIKRLYPAIFAGGLIGLGVSIWAGDPLNAGYLLQFVLLPQISGHPYPLNPPEWSLFWELAVNAAHAAVFRRWGAPTLVILMLFAAASMILRWDPDNFWGGIPRVLYSFGMGILIYRAERAGVRAPKVPYWIIVVALAGCLVTPFPGFGGLKYVELFIVLLAMPIIVVLAIQSPFSSRLAGPAAWLGAVSYPLYAIHYPLLRALHLALFHVTGLRLVVGWCAGLIAVLVVAAVVERYYDAPVRRLLRSRRSPLEA